MLPWVVEEHLGKLERVADGDTAFTEERKSGITTKDVVPRRFALVAS
jgi:hypothetical protein